MLKVGLRPNTVSLPSIVGAGIAGAAAWMAPQSEHGWAWWLVAAAGIQLRLFCNLMELIAKHRIGKINFCLDRPLFA